MRHSPSEKLEIIRIVEDSELSVRQTLKELGIHRSTFYNWYRRYLEDGMEGLGPQKPKARCFWNKIPEEVKEQVVCEALWQTGWRKHYGSQTCQFAGERYHLSHPELFLLL